MSHDWVYTCVMALDKQSAGLSERRWALGWKVKK